jgi:hypothetical protein
MRDGGGLIRNMPAAFRSFDHDTPGRRARGVFIWS